MTPHFYTLKEQYILDYERQDYVSSVKVKGKVNVMGKVKVVECFGFGDIIRTL